MSFVGLYGWTTRTSSKPRTASACSWVKIIWRMPPECIKKGSVQTLTLEERNTPPDPLYQLLNWIHEY